MRREPGLLVPAGNPAGVRGGEDLVGRGLRFINRQGGSGTRVLLDYVLGKRGLDPAAITGYDTEEFTHMAVAVAVASGVADAGLGILAAARALGLGFVPVASERYDLIVPAEQLDSPGMRALLDVITSPELAARVAELGGYDTTETGAIV